MADPVSPVQGEQEQKVTHTPGPWFVALCGISFNGASICSDGGVRVATVSRKADRPYYQKAADARLIAAAPDLLAALKLLKEKFIILDECGSVVDAAIRRAEGSPV